MGHLNHMSIVSGCLILFVAILIWDIEQTASQGVPPVLVLLGWTANFSFQLKPASSQVMIIKNNDTNTTIVFVSDTRVFYQDKRVNFTGKINQKEITFIMRNVTLDDAGRYIAVTNVQEDGVLGEQKLIVKASPTKPEIAELDNAESGANLSLICSTTSNSAPPDHGLAMKSEWTRNSTAISPGGRYLIQGTKLTITDLSYGEDNRAKFTCFAYEDQEAKSKESDEHIINVKYGPDNILLSPSDVIRERETNQIIVNCTADCNPLCSFQWRKELLSGSITTSQSLIINSAVKNDAGHYICTVNNTVTGRSKSVQTTIIVIYGPIDGHVMLSPSASNLEVEETTAVNISCSADCYPVCNYTWTGPHGFYQIGARLSEVLGRKNGGTYTCSATNQENKQKTATDSVAITVTYGPGSSVNLGSISSALEVDLHQKAPNITCNATCNPSCDYLWYKDGSFYSSGATLSVGMVEKNTTGNYVCQAYNSFLNLNRSSSVSVNVTVFYAPEVLLQPSHISRPRLYVVRLGQSNVILTCFDIDSNPPVQQFIWIKNGQRIQNQTGRTLTITMVTRDTIGIWGCKGVNLKGSSSESTLDIDVHYGPIISTLPNVIKVEGDAINVTCVVDSRPQSSISWSKFQSTTFAQNKAELYIVHLNRSDKGTYECTANNTIQPTDQELGERITVKSNFSLNVTYGAGIVNLSAQDSNTVNENSSASFHCHVDSNPLPTITWRRDDNNTILMTESGVLQSQFSIISAQCLDMGNYSCAADNGIWKPANETIQFFVRCHPRRDFRFPMETKLFGKRHTAAVLNYTVISYPLPTFTWTFFGNGSATKGLPASARQRDSGQQSELRFTSLDIDDFGNYSVTANNSVYPSAMEVFEIIPADVPDVPSNITVIDLTTNSVTIQFVAGYSGGPEQTFHIVALAGEFTRSVTASDPGYRKNGTAVLESLLPGTKYNIYITAKNSFGESTTTEAVIIETLEESKPVTGPTLPISAVAGSIGAGVVVIILAIVAIFLWRRYQHYSQHSADDHLNKELDERSSRESGLKDNPVYDSSGSPPDFSINNSSMGAVYAEVVRSKKKADDPITLYAQVDKNPKKGNKGGAKVKGGKASRGDIYENAVLSGKNSNAEIEYENSHNVATACERRFEDPMDVSSNVPMGNKYGLMYADLMFDPPTTKNGKPVIRGIENRTEYAKIAYGKRAESLPDNDDEKYLKNLKL